MKPPTFIGQSHTLCIVEAMIAMGIHLHWGYVDMPDGSAALVEVDGVDRLHPSLAEPLLAKVAESDFVASTIAGNAHTVLGLIAMHPPFDFELPGLDAPLDAEARLVPHGTVRAALLNRLTAQDFRLTDVVLDLVPAIRLHVQSPAPPRDNALCMERIDPYFRDAHPDIEIAAPWLRLKLWRLHSELVREKFAARGIGFLEVPPESLDADGFLLPGFVSTSSSTHANMKYGRLVAEQVQGLRA